MGRVAEVLAKLDGCCQPAIAHLECDILHIRTDRRISVRFSDVKRCTEDDGWLRIEFGINRRLDLHLGAAAERWKAAIESPPTLADKLGAKEGVSIAAIGFEDVSFLGETPCATALAMGDVHDLVLMHVPTSKALDGIRNACRGTAMGGALWVVYPRGNEEIPERLVRSACCADDWVDVKTCRFDQTRSALKFVRRAASVSEAPR